MNILLILSLAITILTLWHFLGVNTFKKGTSLIEKDLLARISQKGNKILAKDIEKLPMPVRKWLRFSGVVNKSAIDFVKLTQVGEMKLTPQDKVWMSVVANQIFDAKEPSFIWSVKTKKAGIPVYGRDTYLSGRGGMVMSLGGMFNVVNVNNNSKVDKGALQRYLAEIVWFPSAALNRYIEWETVSDLSCTATMSYKGVEGSVTFYFKETGEIDRIEAMRYKGVDEKDTEEKWKCYVRQIEERNGVKIPTKVDIAWHLDGEEEFIWYRLVISNFEVEL